MRGSIRPRVIRVKLRRPRGMGDVTRGSPQCHPGFTQPGHNLTRGTRAPAESEATWNKPWS